MELNKEKRRWLLNRFPRKKRPMASISKLGRTIGGAPAGAVRGSHSATARTNPLAWHRKSLPQKRPSKFGCAGANLAGISHFAMDRTRPCERGTKMGVLINGVWTEGELPQEYADGGRFKRAESQFRDRITTDGSSGFKAEPGRYHLYVSHGCPWAHRTLIYHALKKLDDAITVAYAIPGLKQNGWTFERDPRYPDCIPDEVNGFHYLYEAYVASNPAYTGKVTVPTLWDKKTKRIVNNESSEIIRMLNTEFNAITGDRLDLYPQALRAEIDAVNE